MKSRSERVEDKRKQNHRTRGRHSKSVFAKIKSWYTEGNIQICKHWVPQVRACYDGDKRIETGYPSYLSDSSWVVGFRLTGWATNCFFVRETCLTSSTRMNANMEGRKETMTCLHTVVKVSTNRGIQKVDCHRVRVLSCFMSYNEQTDTHKACSKQITPWTEEEHGKHRNVKCLPHKSSCLSKAYCEEKRIEPLYGSHSSSNRWPSYKAHINTGTSSTKYSPEILRTTLTARNTAQYQIRICNPQTCIPKNQLLWHFVIPLPMAGVWREAGRREEEISREAEGSSMISQYDLSMLCAVYMRLGRGHLWGMNKWPPGSEGTLGAWAEVKDPWTEGVLKEFLATVGLKFVKTVTHQSISCPASKSSRKHFTWCFFARLFPFGFLCCSLVGFYVKSLVQHTIGSSQQLRQLKDQILIMKAFWVVLVLVLWFGEWRIVTPAVSGWLPIVHWKSLMDSFQQLSKVWSTRIGWLTGIEIQTETNVEQAAAAKVFSTTLDLYSIQALAKESGDTFCSSKVSGTARGGTCAGRFHPEGVAQLKTLRVTIECVSK